MYLTNVNLKGAVADPFKFLKKPCFYYLKWNIISGSIYLTMQKYYLLNKMKKGYMK